jgi:hypothetical protein
MRKAALALALALLLAACAGAQAMREGLDRETLPADARADYDVFAQKCSKCHSLSRPLNSGITDDEHWTAYVERMRRQPGSGISREDAAPILRFLHYWSQEQAKRKPAVEAPPS